MTVSSNKHELKSKQKLEKKLHFYTKVKDTVTSLNAKKTISKKTKQRSRKKKLKAYDLSSLSEFLPETDASKHRTESKLNCKSKQALVQTRGCPTERCVDQSTVPARSIHCNPSAPIVNTATFCEKTE